MKLTRYRRLTALSRRAPLLMAGCAAATALLVAGDPLSLAGAARWHSRTAAVQARAQSAAAADSTAFKVVYTGSYSYDYTKTSDQDGSVLDRASANYDWTYSGTETLTAVAGDPGASSSSGRYQMLSSGHEVHTSTNFDCSLNSGPRDTFAYALARDPAVGHETSSTTLTFGWSIADPPHPADATRCADGTTENDMSFPIPPSSNGVDPGSFLDHTAELQSAIQNRNVSVRYGQLPLTLPISVDVPERTIDDGTYTQSGQLHLRGQVKLSALSNSCPVGAATDAAPSGAAGMPSAAIAARSQDAQAQTAGGELSVKAGPPRPERPFFRSFKLKLSAFAGGGCRPYRFTWKLLRRPNVPPVKGVRVTVKPLEQAVSAPASSAIQVALTCAVSAKVKRQYGARGKRFLTPCGGPVDYQVFVKDSSRPAKTGDRVIRLRWAPECLEPGRRARDTKERREIEGDLYRKLAADRIAISLDTLIEYVTAGEFAPAFFLKDLAEIGIAAQQAFAKAEMLDAELTEPDC